MTLTRIDPAPTFVFVREGKVDTLESVVWDFSQEPITLGINSCGRVPNIVGLIRVVQLTIAHGAEGTGKQLRGRHPVSGIHFWTHGHDTLEILDDESVDMIRAAPHIGIAFGIVWSGWESHLVVILFRIKNILCVDGRHDITHHQDYIFSGDTHRSNGEFETRPVPDDRPIWQCLDHQYQREPERDMVLLEIWTTLTPTRRDQGVC